MRAFARTDLGQTEWWNGIRSYLTPASVDAYVSTDVTNVTVGKVLEGNARVLPTTTRWRAEVDVTTDTGIWQVALVRADGDWLVERAIPPRTSTR